MQCVIDINQKYYEEQFRITGKWLIKSWLFLCIILILITGTRVSILLYSKIIILWEIIRFLICIVFMLFIINSPLLYGKVFYFIARLRKHDGKVLLTFTDGFMEIKFLNTNEVYLYEAGQIKRIKLLEEYYQLLLPRKYLYININELSAEEHMELCKWFELNCTSKGVVPR